jgi:hypothetical protein
VRCHRQRRRRTQPVRVDVVTRYASGVLYDAFICHASEDKDGLVRPLAERLMRDHVEVWYDEFSLAVGDSLRRSIDRGLANSRFGIVVLSPSFLAKRWPAWELDGLVSRQNGSDHDVILPVWHNVDAADILAYSPPLADKVAASSANGLDNVARRLLSVIHPRGSTLVIARDELIEWGMHPPVVTDDWWLDLAADAESNLLEGGFQEPMGWGRWGFPLPPRSEIPEERGWRLACAALQRAWQLEADRQPITQLTPPDEVHAFIASQPGLEPTCRDHVPYLIAYAPQLVVRGFAGQFEDAIESLYQRSKPEWQHRRATNDRFATALTVDNTPPQCDGEFALRAADFGGYSPMSLAGGFVSGHHLVNGPEVRYFEHVDYLAWLLSDISRWLPEPIRAVLTTGMARWGVWAWQGGEQRSAEAGFEDEPFTGKFADALQRAGTCQSFRPGRDALRDLEHRLEFSTRWVRLPEDGATLAKRVMEPAILDRYFAGRATRTSRRARASGKR